MAVNHTYIVELAQRLSKPTDGPIKLLDYGCGTGPAVSVALKRGFDAYGVDLFYGGGKARKQAMGSGHWGTRIFELRDDKFIPFQDAAFDIVTANVVFEHIEDFSIPVREIDRVLKPGGIFINIFPSDAVWREGHIGIPFSHRMKRDGQFRYWYTLALRSLGFGYNKGKRSRRQWATECLAWVDTWTFYKPLAEIDAAFAPYFTVERRDEDYVAYRIERHPYLRRFARIARSDFMKPTLALVTSRLAFHVLILRKPAAAMHAPAASPRAA